MYVHVYASVCVYVQACYRCMPGDQRSISSLVIFHLIYFLNVIYVISVTYMYVAMEARRRHQIPWSWDTGSCLLLNMGSGNLTWVLWKVIRCS